MQKKVKIYQRRLLVNKSLQLALMFYSLLLAVWVALANLFFQLALFGKLGHQRITLMIMIPAFLLVVFGVTVIFGFVISNRIAGPIYRLKRHMEDVADGKTVDDMKIRTNDYFSEILTPYNRVIAMIREGKKK